MVRRPSGIAQDRALGLKRNPDFDIYSEMAEQGASARRARRSIGIALAIVVALIVVLAIAGSSGGAAFMVVLAFPLALVYGVLTFVARRT